MLRCTGDDGDNCDQCAGSIADGGGDGQLNVAKAHITQSHGTDIQQGHGQISPNDLPGNLNAANENLIGGMDAHDHTNGNDHFELAVFIPVITAANFREEVRSGPTQQCDNCKPKPIHFVTSFL